MRDLTVIGFEEQRVSNTVKFGKIDEVRGSIYTLDGYNLITKVDMENICFRQEEDRVVVYDSERNVIMDVAIGDIDNWMIKKLSDDTDEHVFSIRNKGVYCQMLVCGYEIDEVA